jgi:SAM-dependent methyltransferase
MCCPRCRGELDVVACVWGVDGRLKEGWLTCERCGCSVAEVAQFKFDFHAVGPMPRGPAEPERSDSILERRVHADSAEVAHTSRWHPAPPFFLYTQGRTGDSCSFTAAFTDALARFRTQTDGGIVDVFVDGSLAVSSQLFTPEGSFTVPTVAATGLPATEHEVMIATRGAAPAGSGGTAALLEEIVLYGPPGLEGFGPPAPLNYGNPYSDFIESYLAELGRDQLALEIGGGDRRRVRANHLNFEYLKFELADVYGDIHSLPFKDGAFDVVHSQAVFEHVADPFAAARELLRVTRPGGLVLTEVAFLQPLHAVPYHYFNMTQWGVEQLFDGCEIEASDWFGPLSDTVSWLMDAAGLAGAVEASRLERIRAEFRHFDTLMSHEQLKPVASGVHIAARKPNGQAGAGTRVSES